MEKTLKIFGHTLQLALRDEGDWAVAHEVFAAREYRLCEEAIQKAIHPILDIGAHVGFFSLYASLLNPQASLYAFEPHEGSYALLKQNIKDNRIKNVHPSQVAVGAEAGQIRLHLSQEHMNHSTAAALEPTGETQLAQQTTLERIFRKNRIERCALIKMDCEGAEFPIVYSAPEWIFEKTQALFLEYHDWTPGQSSGDLKVFLEKKGYRVQRIPNARIDGLGFLSCLKA